ncbi:hypothetical protein SAMN05216489_06007 [Streptomyces sp. 3213]|nr:hypothetical protein SAMN05216489_06007 [Streptomyces sp. 3213] [Streptomyces sp. 3213.3]
MSGWIALGAGCVVVAVGVLALTGRGVAPHTKSRKSGWGRIAMGGGFVLDGGARLLGVSSGVGLVVSALALGLVVLGVVLQLRAGLFTRTRQAGDVD